MNFHQTRIDQLLDEGRIKGADGKPAVRYSPINRAGPAAKAADPPDDRLAALQSQLEWLVARLQDLQSLHQQVIEQLLSRPGPAAAPGCPTWHFTIVRDEDGLIAEVIATPQ